MFRHHLPTFWRGPIGAALLVVLAALLIALGAQLALPAWPVPATLQTAAVFLGAVALGARLGGLAAAVYLGAAWLGVPVLAGFAHFGATGLWHAKTAGYVVAFVPTSLWLGCLAQRGSLHSAWRLFVAVCLAHAAVLGVGWVWLGRQIGWATAWANGVQPFWIGAAGLSLLVVLVAIAVRRQLR